MMVPGIRLLMPVFYMLHTHNNNICYTWSRNARLQLVEIASRDGQ